MTKIIRSVTFQKNGDVGIEFVDTNNCKKNGLQIDQVLFIPYGKDYDDEIDAILDAVREAIEDALEDFAVLPVFEPRKPVIRVMEEEDN